MGVEGMVILGRHGGGGEGVDTIRDEAHMVFVVAARDLPRNNTPKEQQIHPDKVTLVFFFFFGK